MAEVVDLFQNITTFNKEINFAFVLIVFTTLIVIFSIFTYYFYKFLSKKNIISLNLYQYSQYENPTMIAIVGGFFYFLEYIIILPILTFFWFAILSVLILLISSFDMESVLLIAAAFVASVRVTSYFNEELSLELAKIIPLTFLVIALTAPSIFNVPILFSRIQDIPALFPKIIYFLAFIVIIEIIMRIAEVIYGYVNKED